MKKIMFVIEQLCSGGAERVTVELANYLCKNGFYEVHLLTYSEKMLGEYELDNGVVRHTIKISGSRIKQLFVRMKQMRRVINKVKPECILSLAATKTCTFLSLAKMGTRIPLIISERNDPSRYKDDAFLRCIRWLSFMLSDGIVFQTKNAQRYYSPKIQNKSKVILNPINDALPRSYNGIRDFRIVNFCRLVQQKNLDLLIDAFNDILDEFPQYTLHIYGDGPEKEHLEEKIDIEGLDGKVFLHSHSNCIYEEIKTAALYVSSSNFEGISNSMLEALAMGIPTVCTDCPSGGAREMIRDGLNGFLVPVGNRNALRDAIKKVLEDDKLAKRISIESTKIKSRISIDVIAKEWIKYIKYVCYKGKYANTTDNRKD